MPFLKKAHGEEDLRSTMTGLKMGDRVLQVGAGDPGLIALLAAKVGISGQAAALVTDQTAADAVDKAAATRGVLVDVKVATLRAPPFAQGWFDVVVLPELVGYLRPHERVGALQAARQVLRVGGRCVVMEKAPRGGLGALFSSRAVDVHYRSQGGAEAALKAEGFSPVRTLAERDGLLFTEGTKPDEAAHG
jgi:SAM-dependent methyltransferase